MRKKIVGFSIFSILFSIWAIGVSIGHSIFYVVISSIGLLASIFLLFKPNIGRWLLLPFYLAQLVYIHGPTWEYKFNTGIAFPFSVRNGDIFNPGSGISVNLLAVLCLVIIYRLLFKPHVGQ